MFLSLPFQAYEKRDAGAVIHSHGIESCLVTMINPLSKEFRVSIFIFYMDAYLFCNLLESWEKRTFKIMMYNYLESFEIVDIPPSHCISCPMFLCLLPIFIGFWLSPQIADHSHGNDKRNQGAWLSWWTSGPYNWEHSLWISTHRIFRQSCMFPSYGSCTCYIYVGNFVWCPELFFLNHVWYNLVVLFFPNCRLKTTQKQQQCLFATMGYLFGETHGSVLKLRFLLSTISKKNAIEFIYDVYLSVLHGGSIRYNTPLKNMEKLSFFLGVYLLLSCFLVNWLFFFSSLSVTIISLMLLSNFIKWDWTGQLQITVRYKVQEGV